MAVSGKTAAPWEVPYLLESDIPDMGAGDKAIAERVHALLDGTNVQDLDWLKTGSKKQIVVCNSSGVPQYVTASGDVTNDESGVFTLASAVKQALFSPGDLKATALPAAPEGWLLCEGQSLLRAGTYAALFAAIGTTYGTVDGTHFNVPDLRGRVPVGVDGTAGRLSANDALGKAGGEEKHTLSEGEMPSHSHGAGSLHTNIDQQEVFQEQTNNHNVYSPLEGWRAIAGWGNHSNGISGSTSAAGSGTAHNNMQPYQVVNYIIKI